VIHIHDRDPPPEQLLQDLIHDVRGRFVAGLRPLQASVAFQGLPGVPARPVPLIALAAAQELVGGGHPAALSARIAAGTRPAVVASPAAPAIAASTAAARPETISVTCQNLAQRPALPARPLALSVSFQLALKTGSFLVRLRAGQEFPKLPDSAMSPW
jgi:hypothetical protein